MEIANRQAFLTGCTRRFTTVDLPNGMNVRIRSLTEREQSEYEMGVFQRDAAGMLLRDEEGNLLRDDLAIQQNRSRLIVLCVVDGEGNRLLADTDVEQVELLDAQDTRVLYLAIQEHCGMLEPREAKKNE